MRDTLSDTLRDILSDTLMDILSDTLTDTVIQVRQDDRELGSVRAEGRSLFFLILDLDIGHAPPPLPRLTLNISFLPVQQLF